MSSARPCDKLGYLGPEASGKTFRGLHDSKGERLIIRLNPTHEPAMEAGAVVVYRRVDLASQIANRDGRKKLVLCWNIPANEIDGAAAFDWACRLAVAVKGRCAIFANEGETIFPKNAKITRAINQVLRQGRQHVKTPLYWTAQRPRDVNLQLRNNSQALHIYRGYDDTYLDFVRGRAGKHAAEQVTKLEPYTCLRLADGEKPTILKKI